ncbi:MAG: acyl-CoA dehydrogenase family protein [Anaerolineae bacterium]
MKYAKERTTFGVPIWQHQGIGFMIADMAMNVEASRLRVWKAAWLVDEGQSEHQTRRVCQSLRRRPWR